MEIFTVARSRLSTCAAENDHHHAEINNIATCFPTYLEANDASEIYRDC